MIGTPSTTVKSFEEAVVLSPTDTVIFPVVAPAGTVTPIWVVVADVTVAVWPLNFTVMAVRLLPKFSPVMVTAVPTDPSEGENDTMDGSGSGFSSSFLQE